MNLANALTEVARVAVSEDAKYYLRCNGSLGWDVIAAVDMALGYKAPTFIRGGFLECKTWIAARVNAAVFAYLRDNYHHCSGLLNLSFRDGLIALANAEAS